MCFLKEVTKLVHSESSIVTSVSVQELQSSAPRRAMLTFMYKVKLVQRKYREFRKWSKVVCGKRIDQFFLAEQEDIKMWHKKKAEVHHH